MAPNAYLRRVVEGILRYVGSPMDGPPTVVGLTDSGSAAAGLYAA